MDIQIANPNNAWLISIVAVGLIATTLAGLASRRAVKQFSTSRSTSSNSAARRWVSASLVAFSLVLIALSLVDIRWGKTIREVPQKGIEVMFLLDVSRSMLAEDASPNRLERAKQQIKDMVDEMAGDRVGLVIFSGDSRQVVPLTSHYDDFKQTLDSVGPHSLQRGGSRLGDAIDSAANGFIGKTDDHKAIVIFTDGEDQESQPVELARELHRAEGIRIFTVGLGDMDQGARIPNSESGRGGFVQYEGQQVWSKMNGEILRKIATETEGAYIPAGTKRVDMAEIYHGYVADIEQTEFETATIDTYIPRFQWLAVPALILLLIETYVSTKRRKNQLTSKHQVMMNSGRTSNRLNLKRREVESRSSQLA